MIKEERAILQAHNLFPQSPAQVAGAVAGEPLDKKKCPIAKEEEALRQKGGVRGERSQAIHDLFHQEPQMRGKGRFCLLHGDSMFLLLARARLNPVFHVDGIARVVMKTATVVVKNRAKHTDVRIGRPSGEMTRAGAISQTV